MNEPKAPAKVDKITDQIAIGAQNNTLSNDDLVQLIELCGAFLNLQTIADYARSHNISYNGAKNNRDVRRILNVRFVIDNE